MAVQSTLPTNSRLGMSDKSEEFNRPGLVLLKLGPAVLGPLKECPVYVITFSFGEIRYAVVALR